MQEDLESPEDLEASLEAPEEAIRARMSRIGRLPRTPRTIEGLRLDVAAAEDGRYWLVLPRDVRMVSGAEKTYPLPVKIPDLFRLSEVKLTSKAQNSRNAGAFYLKRCRRAYMAYARKLKACRVEAPLAEAEETAHRMQGKAERFERDVEAELEKVRNAALATITSMGDLNNEAKAVAHLLLDSFRTGQPVNGEPVKQSTAEGVIGKVFTHVARLGGAVIDSDGKEQAEDAVMAEFVEATREKLRKEVGDGATH